MKNSIFISYRREGGSWSTRSLYDKLAAHFGKDNVFMDIGDIDFGIDFVDKIEKEIGRCNAVLAVISPQWLSVTDGKGGRRLDNPDDYVRLEIGMGLKRRIPVVPILVDGASMPREGDLPDDLKTLSRHNAIELRHSNFDSDIKLLIDSLQKTLKTESPRSVLSNEKVAVSKSNFARSGMIVVIGMAVILVLAQLIFNWPIDDTKKKDFISATDNSFAAGRDMNVGGNLIINQELDPEMLRLVKNTVDTLATQLEMKDQQLGVRDVQINQLGEAIAALAREKDNPNAPPGLDQALTNLEQGDTESAKAIFQHILHKKSAEAKDANQEAAAAARHLGALALLDNDQEALEAYQHAIDLDPDNPEARNQLAYILGQPSEIRLQAVLADGGEPIKTCFSIYYPEQDLDGNRELLTYECTTTARFTLEAGRYFVVATVQSAHATTSQEFDLKPGQLINEVMDLQGGQFRLQAVLADGGEPIETCFSIYYPEQDLDGNREQLTYKCTTTARFTLEAGRYFVVATVQSAHATTSQEFDLKPGQLINKVMDLQGGQFRLQAVLADGGEPIETCFSIYYSEQDLDGNRELLTYECTTTARFTLEAGRYFVVATVQSAHATTSQEFDLKPGQLINKVMDLQGGQFRLQAVLADGGEPIETCFSIYYPEQDLDGNREQLTYKCTTTARFTLEAGRYFVVATDQSAHATTSQEFELKPGQFINQTLLLQ